MANLPSRLWGPTTTRLLRQGHYNAIDDVLDDSFLQQLEAELQPFQDRMEPHSTASGHTVRGDTSVFVGRERLQAKIDPTLCQLLSLLYQTLTDSGLRDDDDWHPRQTSVQLAVYPGDGRSGYPRHSDVADDEAAQQRVLTVILYLTDEDWQAADGGHLRLYVDSNVHDIVPYRGRLIVFDSELEHQVLPSRRRRKALTIWLYGPRRQRRRRVTPAPTTTNLHSPPPLPVDETSIDATSTIFVSMAAFRDSETGPTMRQFVSTARYPDRLRIGLVLQVDTLTHVDDGILGTLPTDQAWWPQVRVLTLDARHATGPCPARALAQGLYRGEYYYLQVDAHMRMRQDWDVYLLQELAACDSTKPILTTYPPGYRLPNLIPNETRPTVLQVDGFGTDGMLRQSSRFCTATKPIRHHLVAAGFLFGPGTIIADCPYDASWHYLFFGEEVSLAARLYQNGYDTYAPSETVAYHLWSRAHRPPALAAEENAAQVERWRAASRAKVQALLWHGEPGRSRTVQEFAGAIGVDFVQQRVLQEKHHSVDFAPDTGADWPAAAAAALDPTTLELIQAFVGN